MDHMMPKMDGLETTKKLRDLGYARPIVALTANAVIGQADVFMTKGFDGFLSKPIDVRQLNAILKKFVRDKQPPEVLEAARREKDAGPLHTAGLAAKLYVDPQLAEIFRRDARRALAALGTMEDRLNYIIQAHAMKSALANIGEQELSEAAARLEQAGRDGDAAAMSAETPAFLSGLRAVIKKLAPPKEDDRETADHAYLREKLQAVIEACAVFDKKAAKDSIAELRRKAWPHQTGDMLALMAESLLNGDFDKVSGVAESLIEKT
jgi:CheY-like chemotaxis protein